jgi:protein-S-isoprenylcysteine O-methyltransferase Ste14
VNLTGFFLKFVGKDYSPAYKIISLLPGTLVFLVLSPLVIFLLARYLSGFIPLVWPRFLELVVMAGALAIAMVLMFWALYELWFKGEGTPAPITPTRKLVCTGPYRFCRNPIELGTILYFLALGIWFDSLTTGIFCLIFGLLLGSGYIVLIEEHELRSRFGAEYEKYYRETPFMVPGARLKRKEPARQNR